MAGSAWMDELPMMKAIQKTVKNVFYQKFPQQLKLQTLKCGIDTTNAKLGRLLKVQK